MNTHFIDSMSNWVGKLFVRDVESVSAPIGILDNNKRLVGYKVTVKYRNRPEFTRHFNVNDTRLHTQYHGPLDAARKYYLEMFSKLRQKNK